MLEIDKLALEMETLLREETVFLEEAAELLRKERKALVSGDGKLLERAVEAWAELAEARKDRDRRRAVLLDRLGHLAGLRPGEVTVSALAPKLRPGTAGRLRAAGEHLKRAARAAALEAAVGRELLEEAARFHEGLIRAIGEAFREKGIVPAGSGGAEGPGISLVDARG